MSFIMTISRSIPNKALSACKQTMAKECLALHLVRSRDAETARVNRDLTYLCAGFIDRHSARYKSMFGHNLNSSILSSMGMLRNLDTSAGAFADGPSDSPRSNHLWVLLLLSSVCCGTFTVITLHWLLCCCCCRCMRLLLCMVR